MAFSRPDIVFATSDNSREEKYHGFSCERFMNPAFLYQDPVAFTAHGMLLASEFSVPLKCPPQINIPMSQIKDALFDASTQNVFATRMNRISKYLRDVSCKLTDNAIQSLQEMTIEFKRSGYDISLVETHKNLYQKFLSGAADIDLNRQKYLMECYLDNTYTRRIPACHRCYMQYQSILAQLAKKVKSTMKNDTDQSIFDNLDARVDIDQISIDMFDISCSKDSLENFYKGQELQVYGYSNQSMNAQCNICGMHQFLTREDYEIENNGIPRGKSSLDIQTRVLHFYLEAQLLADIQKPDCRIDIILQSADTTYETLLGKTIYQPHDNIFPLYDYRKHDTLSWYIMPNYQPVVEYSNDMFQTVVNDLLANLQILHNNNIIQLGITPACIGFHDGRYKLVDYTNLGTIYDQSKCLRFNDSDLATESLLYTTQKMFPDMFTEAVQNVSYLEPLEQLAWTLAYVYGYINFDFPIMDRRNQQDRNIMSELSCELLVDFRYEMYEHKTAFMNKILADLAHAEETNVFDDNIYFSIAIMFAYVKYKQNDTHPYLPTQYPIPVIDYTEVAEQIARLNQMAQQCMDRPVNTVIQSLYEMGITHRSETAYKFYMNSHYNIENVLNLDKLPPQLHPRNMLMEIECIEPSEQLEILYSTPVPTIPLHQTMKQDLIDLLMTSTNSNTRTILNPNDPISSGRRFDVPDEVLMKVEYHQTCIDEVMKMCNNEYQYHNELLYKGVTHLGKPKKHTLPHVVSRRMTNTETQQIRIVSQLESRQSSLLSPLPELQTTHGSVNLIQRSSRNLPTRKQILSYPMHITESSPPPSVESTSCDSYVSYIATIPSVPGININPTLCATRNSICTQNTTFVTVPETVQEDTTQTPSVPLPVPSKEQPIETIKIIRKAYIDVEDTIGGKRNVCIGTDFEIDMDNTSPLINQLQKRMQTLEVEPISSASRVTPASLVAPVASLPVAPISSASQVTPVTPVTPVTHLGSKTVIGSRTPIVHRTVTNPDAPNVSDGIVAPETQHRGPSRNNQKKPYAPKPHNNTWNVDEASVPDYGKYGNRPVNGINKRPFKKHNKKFNKVHTSDQQ